MGHSPGMLIAYSADGEVIATLDFLVRDDEDGQARLVDFAAHEEAGGRLRDIWDIPGAAGSCVWPEFLGTAAHRYRVELDDRPARRRAVAIRDWERGDVRDRADVERRIAERVKAARAARVPADLRDIVGGPQRPLLPEAPEPPRRPHGLPLAGGRRG